MKLIDSGIKEDNIAELLVKDTEDKILATVACTVLTAKRNEQVSLSVHQFV